ncbi:hypothetical protein DFH07DRAFT_961136 [Mycena maculata]|uniref:Myb/SANT-like domain-containing protein n=1 Tax=Mycena maculata TaxID=230809 RepID=A0AAD7NA02_9AGAR|nr:hypothetical protein DFH07DRAFT_962651 [Mycena maculata]KAJ7750923.1 hypothetical protein DFH07DRAFT_961136 [Mycena maculata]
MGKAVWIDCEVVAMLNTLAEHKNSHQSGNGWKSSVWTPVIHAIHKANPAADPRKDQKKAKSKLEYLKSTFETYVFVAKFSGTGWDDTEKHATGTQEYIDGFVATHGSQYKKCFETSCPYYTMLDSLYDRMINRATGDNVLTFGRKKSSKKDKNTAVEQENGTDIGSSVAVKTTPSGDATSREPMTELNIGENGAREGAFGGNDGTGAYDDELSQSPPKPTQPTRSRTRAVSEDEDDSDSPQARKRRKSDSSAGSTGTAKRNAAAGSQLARSVDNLAASMGKPIVTSEDMSYVSEVIEILKDDSLLPPDPNGRLFRHVLKALTNDRPLAMGFIAEERHVRRKGVLAGILEDAGIQIPDDF